MGNDKNSGMDDSIEQVIDISEAARAVTTDLDHALEKLLRSAARAVGSEEASVIVKNSEDENMFFLKAIGTVGDELEGEIIPAGKGIAGFVAISGQPMAISDVGQEESFYAEIDKKTGFSTEILLATPLFFDGESIGVLEFINRVGEPPYAPFTPAEMDMAAVYAEAIAALVNACQASRLSGDLAIRVSKSGRDLDSGSVTNLIGKIRGKKSHKELLELALLVKVIADRGPAYKSLCREILLSVANFNEQGEALDYSDV